MWAVWFIKSLKLETVYIGNTNLSPSLWMCSISFGYIQWTGLKVFTWQQNVMICQNIHPSRSNSCQHMIIMFVSQGVCVRVCVQVKVSLWFSTKPHAHFSYKMYWHSVKTESTSERGRKKESSLNFPKMHWLYSVDFQSCEVYEILSVIYSCTQTGNTNKHVWDLASVISQPWFNVLPYVFP